jgi:Acetyltransferase (GNAT) family
MEIVELHSPAERREVLPILRELYPSLDEVRYAALLAEMIDDGYRQFAVRNEAEEIVAVASVSAHVNLYYGRHLYVYDLVVKEDARSKGYGGSLWTTWKAPPAAKGARRLRLPATWNARGRCTSTSAGATRSPVMRCARRCVERAVALQDCANYFALPKYS